MNNLAALISTNNLLSKTQAELNTLKNTDALYFSSGTASIYKNSIYIKESILFFIARINGKKSLYAVSRQPVNTGFKGTSQVVNGLHITAIDFSYENSVVLKKLFPFTAPISLRNMKTTIGCGDRLGRVTPGHIRAAKKFDVYPVLAQQSIRELNFTNRTYQGVTSDTAFLVFQEGYERGYGADGDHLKTIADIDTALASNMPMITLDLSETMNYAAADWDYSKIEAEFLSLPADEQKRVLTAFSGKTFKAGESTLSFSEKDVKKCTVMYKKAVDFAKEVDTHLKKHRGDAYDLEISVDETLTPTLPEHHLYIIKELNYRGILVNSLAPRFIGEFQKAIDYIGDKKEFERQFAIHCAIAKDNGHYKVSVHSGSDKFGVYPIIGNYTGMKLHLKTAGTSWLEAVRCIAVCEPQLYRKLHKKALSYFDTAKKFYHVTTDISKIKNIDTVSDHDLPSFMEEDNARQLVHITYGGILNDPEIRAPFFDALDKHEDKLYAIVQKHFEKHLSLLGVPTLK
jgi:hypothetical protein